MIFPSPDRQMGVSLVSVEGCYDRAKSRTNRAEAEAVVAEVLQRLRNPVLSGLSIGIITFSINQQNLVEDLLDEARRTNPDIESFFNTELAPKNERIFVKNLENVQGDERDIILFSVCYGPDAQGRVSVNFGPLNRDGGERRLNVAITRARQEVRVFSTLHADQIDLSRTRARGVTDLKCFLDYAERGPVALAEQKTFNPGAEPESPFEQQVMDALVARGYEVHSQVGCSGYRIDLAVVDPDSPGRYLLGIECDGANYHRAKTARDRDRLREMVLRDLGWQLHRVWSTDWWEKPNDELARIEAAIDKAKHCPRHQMKPAPPVEAKIASAPPAAATTPAQPMPARKTFNHYQPVCVTQTLGDLSAFYSETSNLLVCKIIRQVIEQEGPISLNLLEQRVAAHWGTKRVTSKVDERVRAMIAQMHLKRSTPSDRTFLWPSQIDPATYNDFRVPGGDNSCRREASDLPPEEVANAALSVLEAQISLPIDDLIRETSRLFGFQQTGTNVWKFLQEGIQFLLRSRRAEQQDEMIVYKQSTISR